MQKTSGVISALCYLIPIVVTEWLKILHLFLATVFLASRKVLFSSFYGNGDRGAKNHFCNGTRKPPWLHRDVGQNSSCAGVPLLPGAGFVRRACPAEGTRCTCSGGCGQAGGGPAERRAARPGSPSSAAPRQHTAGQQTASPLLTENLGCPRDQRAAPVTQTGFIYLHSAKHNHDETKRRQLAPQEETRFQWVLQANSCRLAPRQYHRPVQLWKMFLKVFK